MAYTHSFSHSFSSEEKLAAQTFAADQPYTRLEVSLKCEKLVETHVFADGNIEPPRKDWKCPANSRRPWHADRMRPWPPPWRPQDTAQGAVAVGTRLTTARCWQ